MTPSRPWPRVDPRADSRARGLRDRLFDQRTVFLWGTLDDEAAGHLAAELMTLDASGDGPIQLHIDCPGGTLDAAFCLIDVIDLLGVDVVATCVGQAVGPALGPLAVAHRRQATPHARLRLVEPVAAMAGHPRDLDTWAAHHRAQLRRFAERLAEAVGRPADAVADDLRTGRYLDAQEAVEYGLIDEVYGPRARVVALPGPRLGFRPRP